MYGIITYIWDIYIYIYGINDSKYAIHGSSGVEAMILKNRGISTGKNGKNKNGGVVSKKLGYMVMAVGKSPVCRMTLGTKPD